MANGKPADWKAIADVFLKVVQVVVIPLLIWGVSYVREVSTEVRALSLKVQKVIYQVETLLGGELVTKSQMRAAIQNSPFPWAEVRDDWVAWRARMDAVLSQMRERIKALEDKAR